VRCEKPVVLREAWHVLVHLWPSPVVARITSGAPGVDPDDVERELAVARHAARAGAPVVRPSDLLPPGPHRHDGHTLVFWHYLVQAGKLDATAAGRGLYTIHDSLADYDGELPRVGRAEEVRAMLQPFAPSDDVELLCELAWRTLPEGQALHGDAHLFNCIQTPAGPIWHDLETACRGPREYDLAALVLSDRSGGSDPEARIAMAAYGNYDEALLDQAVPVYASWVAASFMVAVARRPDAAPALERQLRFLRRFCH
jgi:Phosphotransferase enzyme family